MYRCMYSNEIAKNPVVTPCGHVFEKNVILDFISNAHRCPIDDQPLSEENLIEIQVISPHVQPMAIRATSFNDYLTGLADEWNAVQNELFETRKKLAQCQRELAQALYERDAAKRVIARLISEKDGNIEQTIPVPRPKREFNINEYITDYNKEFNVKSLSGALFDTSIDKAKFVIDAFTNYHINTKTPVLDDGSVISAVDRNPSNMIICGTNTGILFVYDISSKSVKSQHQAHSAPIISIQSNSDRNQILTAAMNGEISVFNVSDLDNAISTANTNSEIITAFWHPKAEFAVVIFSDGDMCVVRASDMEVIKTISTGEQISFASQHPGGDLIAVGYLEATAISIYKLSGENSPVLSLNIGSIVKNIAFSPNGVYMAVATSAGLQIISMKNTDRILQLEGPTRGLAFDGTGNAILATLDDGSSKAYLLTNTFEEIKAGKAPSALEGPVFAISESGYFGGGSASTLYVAPTIGSDEITTISV